jgi:hypothetical protein
MESKTNGPSNWLAGLELVAICDQSVFATGSYLQPVRICNRSQIQTGNRTGLAGTQESEIGWLVIGQSW